MLNVRLACDHLFGKLLFTWLSLVMSMMVSFVLSFFPRDVLDEILNLIESVSEDFLTTLTVEASVSMYRKNFKNWDTWNNYHNCPTFRTVGFYSAVLCSKDADRITNREDPDQTAPWGAVWSGSALFAQTYLSQYLELLRYVLTSSVQNSLLKAVPNEFAQAQFYGGWVSHTAVR